MDLAYQMYKGVHIQMSHEVNYRETGVIIPGIGPQFARIDPAIAQKNIYKSIGNSIYHGGTLSLRKRFSDNYQFEAHYTLSKAIDDQTDFNSAFAAFIPTRLDLDRADSAFDVRHNVVVNGVFKTPWKAGEGHNIFARAFADVVISPIGQIRTGIPFTIRIGRDTNGDTHGVYDRPYFAARNTGRGDWFKSLNLRVNKQFYIKRESGLRTEFIMDITNLTNRVNFLSVNDVFGSDPTVLFGRYNLKGSRDIPPTSPGGFNSAAPGRQVQFGLKIAF
jgi:hypothetical protein